MSIVFFEDHVRSHFPQSENVTCVLKKSEALFFTADTPSGPLFFKCLVGPKGQQRVIDEYEALTWFQEANGSRYFDVITPVASIADTDGIGILVTEQRTGKRCDQLLNMNAWSAKRCAALNRKPLGWLAHFHALGVPTSRALQTACLQDDELEAVTAIAHTHAIRVDLSALANVYHSFDLDTPIPYGLVHGDFISGNIILTGDQAVGFDFTLNNCDYLPRDIAWFFVSNIWRTRPWTGRVSVAKITHTLKDCLASYSRHGPEIRMEVLLCFLIQSLVAKIIELQNKIDGQNKKKKSDQHHMRLLFDHINILSAL
ncbi:MAG: phosphotransferase [Pseudomonadota bacterium]